MRKAVILVLSLALLAVLTVGRLAGGPSPQPAARPADPRAVAMLRRPVALAVLQGRLLAANRRSGTVSALDPGRGRVDLEVPAGEQLADLTPLPDGRSLLAVDEAKGQLIRLVWERESLQIRDRLALGVSPVNVSVAPDGRSCTVALLWPHRLAFVDLRTSGVDAGDGPMRLARTIDLPFAPRKQWTGRPGAAGAGVLVVADSFGGNLAVIDPATGRVRSVRSIQANNIRGMAASPDGKGLLISQPMLEERLPATRDNVFWGNVIGNVLRTVSFAHLLAEPPPKPVDPNTPPPVVPIGHWMLHPLGQPGLGAGDPGEILVSPDGQTAIALSGVNEVAVRRAGSENFSRVTVGRRPTALALSPDGQQLYVANTLDDSISVVDLATQRVTDTISLGSQPPPGLAERGEVLFYDARLSLDGWYSCHTCHTDGHSSGLMNDNLSDGSYDTPKRILSLLGTGDTGPWAWDGSNASLEDQARKSIRGTMQGKADGPSGASDENVAALAAYLRTLEPPPSVAAARGALDAAAVKRGRQAFVQLECVRCHHPPEYTSTLNHDVGLRDQAGQRHFNPPSLRGVSQRPAYFHDNRAASLRDVLVRFKHPEGPEGEGVPPDELEDLLQFLQSL